MLGSSVGGEAALGSMVHSPAMIGMTRWVSVKLKVECSRYEMPGGPKIRTASYTNALNLMSLEILLEQDRYCCSAISFLLAIPREPLRQESLLHVRQFKCKREQNSFSTGQTLALCQEALQLINM